MLDIFYCVTTVFQAVIVWFLLVSLLLVSSSDQEYRVVMHQNQDCSAYSSCQYKSMTNTTMVYKTGTLCSPNIFSACQKDCPTASCQFVRNIPRKGYTLLQMLNMLGLYWGMFFFSAFSEMVLAGVFSKVSNVL